MGDENQVVENSSEVVSEVVSENSTEVVKPVKVKKEKKVKELDILIAKLDSETPKSISEIIVDTEISDKKAKTVLRTAEKKGLVKRVQTEKKNKFTYTKV